MKRRREEDVQEVGARLGGLDEFWKDMLRPFLPLYTRLRCQRLSRKHKLMFAERMVWPQWVEDTLQTENDVVRRNLIEFGLACGFPEEPPQRRNPSQMFSSFAGTELTHAKDFVWEDNSHIHPRVVALNLERGFFFTQRGHTTNMDNLPFVMPGRPWAVTRAFDPHYHRPRVTMLPPSIPSPSALGIEKRIRALQKKLMSHGGVIVM